MNEIVPILNTTSTIFFLCDVQTKFKNAIHGYDHVVATCSKMIKLAKLLRVRVICTTQNAKALGPIDPAIDLESLGPLHLGTFDKTLFSMITEDVKEIILKQYRPTSIVLFGIESHVCVLQTVLSLFEFAVTERSQVNLTVHIVADGVSSCNLFEVPVALERMRAAGAVVETSESIAFQLMRDAGNTNFKAFSQLIKEGRENTKAVGTTLLQGQTTSLVKSTL